MFLWTAFTIGLLGGAHCVGMCGPIAMAVGGGRRSEVLGSALLYNIGRLFSYAMLGLVMGMIGKGLLLAGVQRYFSIGLGAMLLLVALFSIDVERHLLRLPGLDRLYLAVRETLGRALRRQGRWAPLGIGMANGLLPCGLVYLAIVGAINTDAWWKGAAYMALFGLGTVPVMFAVVYFGQALSVRFRNALRKLYPAFLLLMAGLLLARGLQFQVPERFFFWDQMSNLPMCH